MLTKLFTIRVNVTKNVIDLVYYVLGSNSDKTTIWTKMLYIADGGIMELHDIHKSNKNFKILHLFQESEKF